MMVSCSSYSTSSKHSDFQKKSGYRPKTKDYRKRGRPRKNSNQSAGTTTKAGNGDNVTISCFILPSAYL